MSDSVTFLNVDDVKPKVEKVISIKGKKHKFSPPTVSAFIEEMQVIREAQKKFKGKSDKNNSEIEVEMLELTVSSMTRSVKSAFPTLTDEDIAALTYEQLSAIREFINAQIGEANEAAEDEVGNG